MSLSDMISDYSSRAERVKKVDQLLLIVFVIGMGALAVLSGY